MRSGVPVTLCGLLVACGGSGAPASDPGPLVDNTRWVLSDAGEALFGARPADSVCLEEPMDCPEYPWPEGQCVDLAPDSTCIASFIPECADAFTVLEIKTRMPDARLPRCDWITLEQPSLRAIRAGDQVEVRARHAPLTAPVPNGAARMALAVDDQIVFDYSTPIPTDFNFPSATWTAPRDYPQGTRLLWHVDNHGSNEYTLIEVTVLPEASP